MNEFDKIWNETMGCGACDVKPREDCISREQAKKFLYEEIERLHDDGLYDCFSRIIDDMYNELPSVTPERTKGKWIIDKGVVAVLFCSECGAGTMFKSPCCPYCGVEMEVEEKVRMKNEADN